MGQEKSDEDTHCAVHVSCGLYDHYLVDHLLLLRVVLPQRNNLPPKDFVLPESKTETSQQSTVLPRCAALSSAKSHFGSLQIWVLADVPATATILFLVFPQF